MFLFDIQIISDYKINSSDFSESIPLFVVFQSNRKYLS